MLGLDTGAVLNTSTYQYYRLHKVFTMMKFFPTALLFTSAPRMGPEVTGGHRRRYSQSQGEYHLFKTWAMSCSSRA